ncbi:hypothetical protein D3C81_1051070 [compost metagenome]
MPSVIPRERRKLSVELAEPRSCGFTEWMAALLSTENEAPMPRPTRIMKKRRVHRVVDSFNVVSKPIPTISRARVGIMMVRYLSFVIRKPPIVAVTTDPSIIGRSTSPEFVGFPPSTPWMKIGIYTDAVINAAPLRIPITLLDQ